MAAERDFMTLTYFLAWFAVMFPLVFSPGPANVIFAISGMQQGVKKSIPLIAGVDLVFIALSLMIGFGLAEFLETYPSLIITIKLLGIAYLWYLAYKFLRPGTAVDTQKPTTAVFTFYDGLILQLLNPKGWVMLFLMFSLFLDGSINQSLQVVYLVILLAALNISTHFIWVAIGAVLAKYISSSSTKQYLNYFFAISLLLVSLWLLDETVTFF